MKLGAQLYTLRAFTQNAKDFARAMAKVREMGYDTVQISAVGKMSAQTLKNICGDNGLKIALTHTDAERLRTDAENVMREHEIMGCKYIGMGSMPDRYQNADWFPYFVDDYLPTAEAFHKNGMKLMYHNHHFEWEKKPGLGTLFDALLEAFPPSLLGFTLDTYWVHASGNDMDTVLSRLSGRLQCVHYKDMQILGHAQKFGYVGQGNMDFKGITKKLLALGETEYVFVEQDDCNGQSPFDCLKASYDTIRRDCF